MLFLASSVALARLSTLSLVLSSCLTAVPEDDERASNAAEIPAITIPTPVAISMPRKASFTAVRAYAALVAAADTPPMASCVVSMLAACILAMAVLSPMAVPTPLNAVASCDMPLTASPNCPNWFMNACNGDIIEPIVACRAANRFVACLTFPASVFAISAFMFPTFCVIASAIALAR